MLRLGIFLLLQLIPVPMDHPQMESGAEFKHLPSTRVIERVSDYPKDLLYI